MELKLGYKQTEVGVVPENWEVKPLYMLADKIMVGIASAATHAYRDRGIVMFRNQNIKPGYLDDSDVLYIAEGYEETFKNKRLKPGDLLTARTGYPGTTSIVPQQYAGAQSFTTLITRPRRDEVDSGYLCCFINSEAGQKYFEQNQAGGGQKNVNAGSLKNLLVPLPPTKAEQEAIARALSDTDALIKFLEQLIGKKRHLKQGAMQELLSGKRQLPGFCGQWEIKSLGAIGESLIGLTYKPSDVRADGMLVLRSSNVFENKLRFDDNVFVEMEIPERILVKNGDILICVRNGSRDLIGKCAKIDERAEGMTFGAFMAVFRTPFHNFVYHQFQSDVIRRQIHEHLGATINQITNKSLNSFQVPLPKDGEEQTAIATLLSDMDAEIAALEARLTKARQVKQGIVQELLTGRIRLV
jgi:type I restriction enzyme S subunit